MPRAKPIKVRSDCNKCVMDNQANGNLKWKKTVNKFFFQTIKNIRLYPSNPQIDLAMLV